MRTEIGAYLVLSRGMNSNAMIAFTFAGGGISSWQAYQQCSLTVGRCGFYQETDPRVIMKMAAGRIVPRP